MGERQMLRFGAFAPKLSEQLEGQLPKRELKWLDKYADAVTLLKVQSLLSEAEAKKARRRIIKRIAEIDRKHQKEARRG